MRRAVNDFVAGYRLPCLKGGPAGFSVVFDSRIQDGDRTVIKDLPLLEFLRAADSMQRPASLDLTAMGCP